MGNDETSLRGRFGTQTTIFLPLLLLAGNDISNIGWAKNPSWAYLTLQRIDTSFPFLSLVRAAEQKKMVQKGGKERAAGREEKKTPAAFTQGWVKGGKGGERRRRRRPHSSYRERKRHNS